jgi:hypothetical protein
MWPLAIEGAATAGAAAAPLSALGFDAAETMFNSIAAWSTVK